MGRIVLIASLLALLAASIVFAYVTWTAQDGPPMPLELYVPIGLGVAFSLVVGCGLMALVFYSHRHGYDDAAHGAQADEER
jgi:hypothetical protein